jgi:phage terminase large subunit
MIIAPKVARWAVPLIPPCRYKGAKGGRSGGKSHQGLELAVAKMAADPNFKVVGIREIQKSLRFSVKSLMEAKIREMGVAHLFDMQDKVIKRIGGSGIAIFEGMQDHTADSIKGLEDFDLALVDEANQLSARSLKLLTPTLRKSGSEIWFFWNPDLETDAVDAFFKDNEGHEDFICVHVNIGDNPFISDTGWNEYVRAKKLAKKRAKTDPNAMSEFLWIWHGEYNVRSDKFVFRNWREAELEVPDNIVWFHGADWGFANDPTASLRCCIIETPKDERDILYVDYEACEIGVSMENTPELLSRVPGARDWPLIADSARPETIDYVRRNGFRKIRAAKKGKGSIEHGITFLKSFDIVIHPRCAQLKKELQNYAYKVDRMTEEILPVVVDAWNHLIDALRYAVEKLHRKGKLVIEETTTAQKRGDYGIDDDEMDEDSWKVA